MECSLSKRGAVAETVATVLDLGSRRCIDVLHVYLSVQSEGMTRIVDSIGLSTDRFTHMVPAVPLKREGRAPACDV